MGKFNDFIMARQFNLSDFMLDEGEGQQFDGQRFPIPLNLAMFLSLVPGGPSMQGQALKYVMTDALYRACKGRQDIAKQMSQKLGREVKEYEVFSPDVHAQDPQIAALWKQMAPEYFEKYEPKHIRLDFRGNTGDVLISIPKLNVLLGQHGLPPLEFGGPKGLVELMESGRKWAKPFQSVASYGEGPAHDRNGIDLSHPRIHQYADKRNEPRVAFGFSPNMDGDKREYREPGWEPKINTPYYTRRLSGWLRRMSDKAETLMQGIPEDDPQKEQFIQLFGSIMKGMTRGAESIQDKTFGYTGGLIPFDDLEEYEEIKKKVADGLNAFNAMPDDKRLLAGAPLRKAKPEEIEAMMKKMFPLEQDDEGNFVPTRDEQGNLLVNQQVSNFGPYVDAAKVTGKTPSKLLISSILNWLHFGTTATPQGKAGKFNPQRGDFNPMMLNQDLPGLDDIFEKPVSTQKVMEGGLSTDILKREYPDYFPMDDSEGTVESKIAGMKSFYLTDGKDEIKFHFDKKVGKWIASQMTGKGEKHTGFKRKDWGGSPIVLPGNDQFGSLQAHSFDHIPLFDKKREKWLDVWDKFAKMTGGSREEEVQIIQKKTASQVRNRGGDNDYDAFKDDVFHPLQAFEKLLGSPKFFFGDTGKHFMQLLAKNNFDSHEAKEIASVVNGMLSSGKIPTPEAMNATFGPEGEKVYQLLLQNGKGWRIGTVTAMISGQIATLKKMKKEKSGVGGAPNQDGQTQDVMANAGTNAAALRHAAGDDASTALSGKLDRSISGRGVIGTGEKADISKLQGHISSTDIYKKEGEAAVGSKNVETFNQFYDHFKSSYQGEFKPNDVESLWTINSAISKLQNTQPEGDVVRAAGNAAVMDVLHDEIKKYAASINQDSSKRALAYILFNMFSNPEGGLKEILTGDDEEQSSVDTEPLITQVQPLLRKDKDMEKYFTMLRKGEPLEGIPPAEEKPGLKVVGQPSTAPAKPTFGGTSGGGLVTTNQPPEQGFEFNGQYYNSEEQFFDRFGDFNREDMDESMPPNTWHQIPAHIRPKVQAQYNKDNMTGLQKAEMMSIHQFFTMLRETDAIFDGSKPTTFNWWVP